MKKTASLLFALLFLFINSCKKDQEKEKSIQQEKENQEFISKMDPSYQQIGLNIAFTTKAQLGKNLMEKISSNGVEEAIQFCNIKALSITDSMATLHNANIKRVSDKTRNPNNTANEVELKNIETFKVKYSNGEEIAPIVETTKDSINFYYPIITNEMCLKCHGTPSNIDPSSLKILNELYPTDKAFGYSENEIRGIWSIRFKNNK